MPVIASRALAAKNVAQIASVMTVCVRSSESVSSEPITVATVTSVAAGRIRRARRA